jgi:hypothetical protein
MMKKVLFFAASIAAAALMSTAATAQPTCWTKDGVTCTNEAQQVVRTTSTTYATGEHAHTDGDGWIGFHATDNGDMNGLYDAGSANIASDGRTITWDSSLPVAAVEYYVGHGQRGGFVARKRVTGNSAKLEASRFNLVMADGRYLYVAGDKPTALRLSNLGVATDLHDRFGQVSAALTVLRR